MTTIETKRVAGPNDAELVAGCLEGRREAFRQIVERYQSLICSLAYSATGSVSQSEDVAQETFLSAWKDLGLLREPDRLRAWLCGIARNRILRIVRGQVRDPMNDAMPLENAHDCPAGDLLPSELASRRDEEAILWRTLKVLPEIFREPLILFYRENQSVEAVATELELSEDVVRQRLSRGRSLLNVEVQSFVEHTLRRTAPGPAFSNSVILMLPLAAGPAATAALSIGTKGLVAKLGFLAVWMTPVVLTPFVGTLGGIAAQWLIILGAPPEPRLRVKTMGRLLIFWMLLMGATIGVLAAMRSLGHHFEWSDRIFVTALAGFWRPQVASVATSTRMIVSLMVGVVAGILIREVARRNGWKICEGSRIGINLSRDLKCPRCGAPAQTIRIPKNFRQALWGGSTCARCGAEYDKWSRLIPGRNSQG
jgi:RNA polymerase sigma factor (sigma-70 family)